MSQRTTFRRGIGLPGRVWENRTPAWIPDVVADTNFPRAPIAAREGLHAAFGFPILLRGEVFGVMEFFSREIREPYEHLLPMLTTVGNQIGLFIERRRAQDEFSLLFALSPDMLCIAGRDGYLKRVNLAWQNILGYSEAELLSRPYMDFVHPDDAEASRAEVKKLFDGSRVVQFENRCYHKDDTVRWLLWAAAPPHRDPDVVYAAARDVTERKAAEELRARTTNFELLDELLAALTDSGELPQELRLAINVAKIGAAAAHKAAAPDPWDDLVVPQGLDVKLITEEVIAAVNRGDGNPFGPDTLPPLEIVPEYRHLISKMPSARLSPEPQDMDGSNNWVVAGKLSPTGVPILAGDPHRVIEMPSLRYFVHLVSPGWNVVGGTEPPYLGVDGGSNENMAWAFTFAGIDMVDTFVEHTNPADPNQTMYNGSWEPMRIIREEIRVKGEDKPRVVELKFTRHGPVFHEDITHHRAYVAKSVIQEPGTAAFKGSLKLAQAESCEDFFERAMFWKVPTHNVICGDKQGNIALQVSGLTPDRQGWNGRLPVPGTGK